MKKQTGFRLTEKAFQWLEEQSQKQGISKNDIVQILINNAMKSEARANG